MEHAHNLRRLAHPHPVKWAINKNERQPMLELARHDIICQPAENDQLAGIERVKTWLFNRQLWFVEDLCRRTIQQMLTLRYADPRKDGQSRDVTLVYKRDDELPDCTRYITMVFPMLPKSVIGPQERDISNLPDAMQHDIRTMRKMEQAAREPQVVNDFWA